MENSSLETLTKLAEASKLQRLPAADEEQATALLKELLSGGRAGITSAIEPLVGLPWIVGANAVGAVWPTLTVPMRRHLLTSVAKIDSEPARRLRLSLARAIFKLEPAAGLKVAAAATADLREPETGALSAKHRHMFFNVFIGKGKPWLLQLPLADLKSAEADCLVHCAIECFQLAPPLSQLSILRWAHTGGRLKKLAAGDLEAAAKSVSRWKVNLQRQLRTEIPALPEGIAAVLKPEALEDAPIGQPTQSAENRAGKKPETPARDQQKERAERRESRFPETPALEAPPAEAEVVEEIPSTTPAPAIEPAPEKPEPKPIEEITIPRRNRQEAQPHGQREERPGREPRDNRRAERQEQPRQGGERTEERREDRRDEKGRRPFDFKESLRGLESYVSTLRSELEQTKNQLRRREEEPKRSARPARTDEKPSVDSEALLRHNAQLETTVQELRQQLEDLASHHESVAESRQLHSGEPLAEGSAEQLKALLSIKLQESFETYLAMRQEPLDKVFRLDYRDLLGSVYDVLLEQGVELKKP